MASLSSMSTSSVVQGTPFESVLKDLHKVIQKKESSKKFEDAFRTVLHHSSVPMPNPPEVLHLLTSALYSYYGVEVDSGLMRELMTFAVKHGLQDDLKTKIQEYHSALTFADEVSLSVGDQKRQFLRWLESEDGQALWNDLSQSYIKRLVEEHTEKLAAKVAEKAEGKLEHSLQLYVRTQLDFVAGDKITALKSTVREAQDDVSKMFDDITVLKGFSESMQKVEAPKPEPKMVRELKLFLTFGGFVALLVGLWFLLGV